MTDNRFGARKAIVPGTEQGAVSPAEKREANRVRRPLGVPRRKLEVPVIEGYHVHVINDLPGRLDAALDGGYEFCSPQEAPSFGSGEVVPGNSDLGARVSRVVGKTADGVPLRAYLMKINLTWYNEDRKAKDAELDKIDAALKAGQHDRKPGDGRYVSQISMNRV